MLTPAMDSPNFNLFSNWRLSNDSTVLITLYSLGINVSLSIISAGLGLINLILCAPSSILSIERLFMLYTTKLLNTSFLLVSAFSNACKRVFSCLIASIEDLEKLVANLRVEVAKKKDK